ncbi:MAG: DUF2259 domain-containing protein [Treponema sp.]|uniref:DUF2259 domain-containing protein n=1 Tax=Treponema sp. TaxID=166 RepID=UPI001DBDA3C0|nr:DUF2259 domain-containing protein [Treponema sp.]MBS7241966.1 DUF2259 domain-containing protein [Treponema sp.]
MRKILTIAAAVILTAASAFAGDAASFVDIGFSEDGKTYIFGTYGKTDKNYEPWAEIYTVDVAANEFVKGEVFKSKKGDVGPNASGKDAFDKLKSSTEWKIGKYNAKPANAKTLLYLRDSESKGDTEEIVFKDFENSTEDHSVFYNVRLVPEYEGYGKNVKSKFYINVVRKDENGDVLSTIKVGTPDFKRKGISSYKIDKIFTDASGKSLVFIVQKKLEDNTGTSIRYMVETYRF